MEERRRPTSLGKRKASGSPPEDEASDLQRAVKKLIQKAQLEADSPSHSLDSAPGSGFSPAKAQGVDMRIFSDTPRDRPVFDAYPMPPAQPPQPMLQVPNQAVGGTSPFTFPVDPTNANFPPFDPRTFGANQQPQLDPAVESILSNYFPQPQTANNMGNPMVPQVPDDFLSKVFNFGWDTSGNNGMNMAQNQPGQIPNQPGQQGQPGMMTGFEGVMNGNGGFDGWSAHGWMA